jgi:hypothetical protein
MTRSPLRLGRQSDMTRMPSKSIYKKQKKKRKQRSPAGVRAQQSRNSKRQRQGGSPDVVK